jgi:hypothetical protein
MTILFLWSSQTPVSAGDTSMESCLQHSLTTVLSGGDMTPYLDTVAIIITMVGRQNTEILEDKSLLREMSETVLAVLTERVRNNGKRYQGAVVHVHSYDHTAATGLITTITGHNYAFKVLGNFTSGHCQIRQLAIEDLFRLTSWLARQPAVARIMSKHHLK